MANALSTSLVASFDSSDSGSSVSLSIENDLGAFTPDQIHLLLFPAVPATLVTTAGEAQLGNRKPVNVPGGVVTFGGSTTASLPKRADASAPTIEVLFAFDAKGNGIRDLHIAFDNVNGTLTADHECYAAVKYGPYQTLAFELLYTPEVDSLGDGDRVVFGSIVAYYPPSSILVYDVQPFQLDTGNSVYELYRIVSEGVTTQDGRFEKPPNYPTSGSFEPLDPLVIDTQTMLINERVHEIGQMDTLGRAYVQTYFVPKESPFQDTPDYQPLKTLRTSSLPDTIFTSDQILAAKAAVAARGQGKL